MNGQELVTLYRKLRDGRETRETMRRYIAELVIGCIAEDEPQTASARIERLDAPVIDPSAPYPIKQYAPERIKENALTFSRAMFGNDLRTVRQSLVA